MKLKHIFVITGKSGLFKLVSESPKMIIVESIVDGTKTPIYAHDKASSLGEICILTTSEDVTLKEVFKRIREKSNGGETISHKSEPEALKAYFGEIVPNYDRNRVYTSDMKKVITWYNILCNNDLLAILDEVDELDEMNKPEEEVKQETASAEEAPVEKVKKAVKKKTAAPSATTGKKTTASAEVKSSKAPKTRSITKKG